MNDNTCFFYYRDRYNVTIAYKRVRKEGDTFSGGDKVVFGAAFCNSLDPFVKSKGRQIAHGRMRTIEDAILVSPDAARWEVHDKILEALSERYCAGRYIPDNFRYNK